MGKRIQAIARIDQELEDLRALQANRNIADTLEMVTAFSCGIDALERVRAELVDAE